MLSAFSRMSFIQFQIPSRCFAKNFTKHDDEVAGVLVSQSISDVLDRVTLGHPLQGQKNVKLPAPPPEAQAGFFPARHVKRWRIAPDWPLMRSPRQFDRSKVRRSISSTRVMCPEVGQETNRSSYVYAREATPRPHVTRYSGARFVDVHG